MDQNNYQGYQAPQEREPLPNYGAPNTATNNNREPLPTMGNIPQNPYQQPYAQNPYPQQSDSHPAVEESAGSAFGKGLAATIMAWFPICSIIAIILGTIGSKLAKQTDGLAARYGVSAGGKNVAAKILSKIGLISGIVMTVFYMFYIILIAALI